MSYETDKVLVLAGTGSNYIAATHYESSPFSAKEHKAIHLRVRKHEHEVAGFGAHLTGNGYGIYLDKERWLKLRAHCDALFTNDEATGRNNIEVKLKVDASKAREAFRDAKESTQDSRLDSLEASIESLKEYLKKRIDLVLDDIDDVHDAQDTVIRGLERRVESLQDKVGALEPQSILLASSNLASLSNGVGGLGDDIGKRLSSRLARLEGEVANHSNILISIQGEQHNFKRDICKAAGGFDF